MIRINLLPIRATRKRETVQQQLLAFAGVLIIAAFACIAWWKFKNNEYEERQQAILAKKQELAQLDKIIGEVNEFTTKKKELEDKLAIIQQLKKGKSGPVRALDEIASDLPKRVWLTAMTETGGQMKFEGKAIDHEDVSAFMKALQKSKYFSNVNLGFSRLAKDSKAGSLFYEFSITCAVNYSA
jgi:type IV pilus assembly protein PilN